MQELQKEVDKVKIMRLIASLSFFIFDLWKKKIYNYIINLKGAKNGKKE